MKVNCGRTTVTDKRSLCSVLDEPSSHTLASILVKAHISEYRFDILDLDGSVKDAQAPRK